ncbi:MAG: diguanylate cyclase, partial [Campylobacterota bacterium]|nr:diguanylate cyclase [Campylobacterota bacterium]
VSVGVAIYPNNTTTQMELLQKADQAMYVAKEKNSSNFSYHICEMNKSK